MMEFMGSREPLRWALRSLRAHQRAPVPHSFSHVFFEFFFVIPQWRWWIYARIQESKANPKWTNAVSLQTELGKQAGAFVKNSASSKTASGFPTKHLPTRSQAAKALLHQGTALLCRSKIPTNTLLRKASALRGERDPERRTRLIELRRPRLLQRTRQSIQREEEKPKASRRVAMAQRTTPTLNGHFCRKLRRKERRSRIGARPSALRARIILSRYLRTPPLFFHAQKSYLMSSGRAPDLRFQVPKPRKLQVQRRYGKNKRHPPWGNPQFHLWMRS
jgi:hypothetical protein